MPKELLTRYKLACDQESDPQRFRELAQDFAASTSSFGYDALQALQAHYADCAVNKSVIDGLLVEIEARKHRGLLKKVCDKVKIQNARWVEFALID
jgi:hypothetical protein